LRAGMGIIKVAPADEVQDMAQQIATEYALVHFGQFPDKTASTHAR
jgi:hypothetical protein